jgi:arginine-tRNA-protein transferase
VTSAARPAEAARARLARLVGELGLEATPPSPCPYLPGRSSRLLAIRPTRFTPRIYDLFLDLNFRRLQDLVYRPECGACRECRQLRVDVLGFRATRSQRRCLKRNSDVVAESGPPHASDEKLALYRRYLEARHDGSMSGSADEFVEFLYRAPQLTREVEFRIGGRLLGAGLFDVTRQALSAVYFYFDPELEARSPGTLNVLWLVGEAKRRSRPWLYLGYYVRGSPTMAYKAGFHPHQLLGDGGGYVTEATSRVG